MEILMNIGDADIMHRMGGGGGSHNVSQFKPYSIVVCIMYTILFFKYEMNQNV